METGSGESRRGKGSTMWGQPSKIVVFGLFVLAPGWLGAQERSSHDRERGGQDISRQDGRIGPWSPRGWETQPRASERDRSDQSDRRRTHDEGVEWNDEWEYDDESEAQWGERGDDDDEGWRAENWRRGDPVDHHWDRGATRRYGEHGGVSEVIRGNVRFRVGPIFASIDVGDRTLERAIRRCQRQTHRSRTWCRREVLRRHTPRSAWARARWNQVYVQQPRHPNRRQRLSRRELQHTLEPWVLDRIRRHGERLGLRGNLRGTWEPAYRYGSNIDIRLDGVTIARIRDLDGDGWADDVFLRR